MRGDALGNRSRQTTCCFDEQNYTYARVHARAGRVGRSQDGPARAQTRRPCGCPRVNTGRSSSSRCGRQRRFDALARAPRRRSEGRRTVGSPALSRPYGSRPHQRRWRPRACTNGHVEDTLYKLTRTASGRTRLRAVDEQQTAPRPRARVPWSERSAAFAPPYDRRRKRC